MKLCQAFSILAFAGTAFAWEKKKPNIVVIWGDDIGESNLSIYSKGVMGYQTPNIDRIAKEGMLFTDSYGEQSCTAGRSAFLTGQVTYRTGLSKVGMPGAEQGIQDSMVTIASLLKNEGYNTGQFGKNHVGDRNAHLPTAHGFDEFFGNLYHLNANEEPELHDYPENPEFLKMYGPRGVLHCHATPNINNQTLEDPDRFGPYGHQVCEDTGPLDSERMKTFDDEVVSKTKEYLDKQVGHDGECKNPFFLWINFSHMHFRTHTKDESMKQAGEFQSTYHDTMIDHDANVGQILDYLDELGLAKDAIVIYSTDNGPHRNTWPDAGTTKFRSEKNTQWEGAFRVPQMIRWPGKIEPGSISNDIISHLDWIPTLLAAAGNDDIVEKLRYINKDHPNINGTLVNGKRYFNYLDGYNYLPYLTGKNTTAPRIGFYYFTDDGDFAALRYGNWKLTFMEQDSVGTLDIWQRTFRPLRLPTITNLRTDPFEYASITSNTYWDFILNHVFLTYPMNDYLQPFYESFINFPPAQEAGSFTIGDALDTMSSMGSS